jgi:hypothetical protein
MYEAIKTSYRDGDDDRDWYSPAHTLRKETYRCRTKCYAATGEANTSCQKAESLSQNSKNAKKSVIFIVVKGQLLTKFVLRYGGGHGTQTVSVRSDRCPMALSPTAHPPAGTNRSAPRR